MLADREASAPPPSRRTSSALGERRTAHRRGRATPPSRASSTTPERQSSPRPSRSASESSGAAEPTAERAPPPPASAATGDRQASSATPGELSQTRPRWQLWVHNTQNCDLDREGAKAGADVALVGVMHALGPSRLIGRVDLAIATLASSQHGVVSHSQLVALGLSEGAIQWRLRVGRLHQIRRGVYLVGHPVPPPLADEMAAQLGFAPDALDQPPKRRPPVGTAAPVARSSAGRAHRRRPPGP